jgi:hypothetical protein
MSTKNNTGNRGKDGAKTRNKGESQRTNQKGALSVPSNKGKHKKDDSDGAERNTTKKQANSI